MSNQGFTPGPWLHSGRTVYALNDEGFNRFSALVQDAHAPAYELDANTLLMAAAPELLAELEETHAALCFTHNYIGTERYKRNRAAIAKARGTPC